MTSSQRLVAIALVLAALPTTAAQAGDGRQKPMSPRDRAAIETARTFSARLSRLDALMGGVPSGSTAARARSADAEH